MLAAQDADIRSIAKIDNDTALEFCVKHGLDNNVERIVKSIAQGCHSVFEISRLESLRWARELVLSHNSDIMQHRYALFPSLLQLLADDSSDVFESSLNVLGIIFKQNPDILPHFIKALIMSFANNRELLVNRGSKIVIALSDYVEISNMFRIFASLLQQFHDKPAASDIIFMLHSVLVAGDDCRAMRAVLPISKSAVSIRQQLGQTDDVLTIRTYCMTSSSDRDLFAELYSAWCHNPLCLIGLCWLARVDGLARYICETVIRSSINIETIPDDYFARVDILALQFRGPSYAHVRMAMVFGDRHSDLLRSLQLFFSIIPPESEQREKIQNLLELLEPCCLLSKQCHLSSGQPAQTPRAAMLQSYRELFESMQKSSSDVAYRERTRATSVINPFYAI